MKNYIIILFLFSLLTACNQPAKVKDGANNVVVINPTLQKFTTDTLDINWTGGTLDVDWGDGKIHPNKKYPFSFFDDQEGICRIFNDTLFIVTHQGYGPSNSLDIAIYKDQYFVKLMEHNCTYSHNYKPLKQSLTINKSSFSVGDTLTGELFYQAIYVWDSIRKVVDTTTISGKFKLKIRDKDFDRDSLYAEQKFAEFLELSIGSPDTVKELSLSRCGLNKIPEQLLLFKNLQSLDLSNNDFERADLSSLCNFKKLKDINLDHCNLNKLPEGVLCLTQLEGIDIFANDISNLPDELFNLKNLKRLQVESNGLTNLSEKISNLQRLEELDLAGNSIKKLPKSITLLRNLKEFLPPDSLEYLPKQLAKLLSPYSLCKPPTSTIIDFSLRCLSFAKSN